MEGGGSGFRVHGSGFRVYGSGFRVQGSGFGVQGLGFRVQGLGFRVQGFRGFKGLGLKGLWKRNRVFGVIGVVLGIQGPHEYERTRETP